MNQEEHSKYMQRGVSSDKLDVHTAIAGFSKGLFPKAFCKIIDNPFDHTGQSALIMHADGAGTKSALAYAYWKTTGDISVWEGIAQDALVMNTDDLLCVGANGSMVVSSTIGRNKHLIPGEVIKAIIQANEALAEQFNSWGIPMIMAGGETADLGDLVRTIVVDTSVVAQIDKSKVVNNAHICPGSVIVGLCSYGQTHYEKAYNSGIGSNGLTSARHDLFHGAVGQRFPETFDPNTPPEAIYCGPYALTDIEPETGIEFAKLALSPTRTYAPVMHQVLTKFRKHLHGIVHCSGGGQTKVLHFAEKVHIIKNNLFKVPPLFKAIQAASGAPSKEMYKVFNMGHRMEIYGPESIAQEIIDLAASFGLAAQVIGHCEPSDSSELTIKTDDTSIHYQK